MNEKIFMIIQIFTCCISDSEDANHLQKLNYSDDVGIASS